MHQVTLSSCSLTHFCIIQKPQNPTSKPKTSISTRQPPLFQLIMQFLRINPTVFRTWHDTTMHSGVLSVFTQELCFKLLQELTGQQKPQPCLEARELPQFKAAHHAGVQQETTAFPGNTNKHHLTFRLVRAAHLA